MSTKIKIKYLKSTKQFRYDAKKRKEATPTKTNINKCIHIEW